MNDSIKHKRETTTILSFIEKPALNWLANKLPEFMTPDFLTVVGMIGSFLTGLGYFLSLYSDYYLWLANFGLLLNWFGDSLDGTVARFRHIERPKLWVFYRPFFRLYKYGCNRGWCGTFSLCQI